MAGSDGPYRPHLKNTLKRSYDEASLQLLARDIADTDKWRPIREVNDWTIKAKARCDKLHRDRYRTYVERETRRILAERTSRKSDLKPGFSRRDLLNGDDVRREAHRRVRQRQEQRLAAIDAIGQRHIERHRKEALERKRERPARTFNRVAKTTRTRRRFER